LLKHLNIKANNTSSALPDKAAALLLRVHSNDMSLSFSGKIFLALMLLVQGCGSSDHIVVASKNFSENVLLGEVIAQKLESHGFKVDRRLNLGSTFLCHQALASGGIDIYPEYTGTALTAVLNQPVVRDPAQTFALVHKAYLAQFQAEWLAPFGFNNTFAVMVRDSEPAELATISDLARVAKRYTIGYNFEFEQREDGYDGMKSMYGLEFATEPKSMDLNLVYQALEQGQVDVAVGNSTHGLIERLGLRVLDDDRQYFPPYDAAAIVRSEALSRFAGLREALAELSGAIDETTMRELNRQVDVDQVAVEDVAADFLGL